MKLTPGLYLQSSAPETILPFEGDQSGKGGPRQGLGRGSPGLGKARAGEVKLIRYGFG